jgi:hypothetical protein
MYLEDKARDGKEVTVGRFGWQVGIRKEGISPTVCAFETQAALEQRRNHRYLLEFHIH